MIFENGKIWLFLTEEDKIICLTPPANTTMRCTQVTIEQFEQILKNGFFITSNNEGIRLTRSPSIKYTMDPIQIAEAKAAIEYRS